MSINELAQLDPREAFDSIDEASFYLADENSFMACYLSGMAFNEYELAKDEDIGEWWGLES